MNLRTLYHTQFKKFLEESWKMIFEYMKVSLQERIGDYSEIETADLNPLPNNSTIRDCLQGTTSLQKSFSSFGHYFYPFQLEFSLSSFAPLRSLAMRAKESGEF